MVLLVTAYDFPGPYMPAFLGRYKDGAAKAAVLADGAPENPANLVQRIFVDRKGELF